MRRNGTVAGINPNRGMVAIATDEGFTIVEIASGWAINVGDEMAWEDGYHIGPTIFENLSKSSREGVFVKNHHVGESELDAQLLR